MIFRQLFDPVSSTYTYLLADPGTREALLIDPVFEQVRRDLALLRELDLKLVATLETHVHADHVTGAWLLQQRTPPSTSSPMSGTAHCTSASPSVDAITTRIRSNTGIELMELMGRAPDFSSFARYRLSWRRFLPAEGRHKSVPRPPVSHKI